MSVVYRPKSLAEALALRAEKPLTVMSGATDLYPARTNRMAWGDMRQEDVLDLSAVPGLDGIHVQDGLWHIGARVTWTQLVRAELPPLFDGLKTAGRDIGGVQIQNRGTLAGNLCTASPAGDGIPCLMALEAKVVLASTTASRTVLVENFLLGYRKVDLRPDEIVTGFLIPDRPQARGAFAKFGARRYLVISIAMVSAVIALDSEGRISHARIAVGACGPVAKRLPSLEAKLLGHALGENLGALVSASDLKDLSPIDDVRATASYRLGAAEAQLRDLLTGFRPDLALARGA